MNIANINASSKGSISGFNMGSSDVSDLFKEGHIIEGIISKVSEKISINFSGKEMKFPKSAVQNAKEGEVRKFEIKDVSESSIVLKEVGKESKGAEPVSISRTNVKTDQSLLKESMERTAEEKAGERAKVRANQIIADKINRTADRLTAEDYQSIESQGETLESYEASRLERALNRMKEQREFRDDRREKEIDKNKEYQTQIEQMARTTGMDSPYADDVIQKMQDADIPFTKENFEKIATSMDLASMAGGLSDKAMEHLLSNELAPTLENVYKAEFSGSGKYVHKISSETFGELEGQISAVIEDAGHSVNEDSLQDARWLLERDLPLTKESFLSLINLKEIRNMAETGNLVHYAAQNAIHAITNGENTEQTVLEAAMESEVKQQINQFQSINNEAIQVVVGTGKKLNLTNLLDAEEIIKQDSVMREFGTITNSSDAAVLTARRQLEEIRLKMTAEAGMKMRAKGISLDITELSVLVDELRSLENEYYEGLLRDQGAEGSIHNIGILRNTVESTSNLRNMPSFILGMPKASNGETLQGLHDKGLQLQPKLERAGIAYDTLSTAPNRQFGDSILKAFQNVDTILDDLELEETQANRRAVRILGYNELEITKDSVLDMKYFDSQVNSVLDKLHPAVTVQLIKDGVNPLDIPVEQLNEMIENKRSELNIADEEKYSKFLWKLEKQNHITEDERSSYIGIYRLLNHVEKSDGAAVGAVVNAGQELTLNNLLTAVRTSKSGGIDKEVDDNTGMRESLTFTKETITDQIGAAYSSDVSSNLSYTKQLLNDVLDLVTPERLNEIGGTEDIYKMSLESLKEKLSETRENKVLDHNYYSEKAQHIRELAKNSEPAIELLNHYNIPVTFQNLEAAGTFVTGGNNIYKGIKDKFSSEDLLENAVNEIFGDIEDGIGSKEGLESKFNLFEKVMADSIEMEYQSPDITSERVAQLRNLNDGIKFLTELSKKEHYEIPVVTGEQVTNMKLTIIHGADQKGKVHLKIDSDKMGTVEAEFTLKDGKAKGFILGNNRIAMEEMKASADILKESFRSVGIEAVQFNFGIDRILNHNHYSENETNETNAADTSDLYQAAKVFVKYIKELERI